MGKKMKGAAGGAAPAPAPPSPEQCKSKLQAHSSHADASDAAGAIPPGHGCVSKCVESGKSYRQTGHGAYKRNGYNTIKTDPHKSAYYDVNFTLAGPLQTRLTNAMLTVMPPPVVMPQPVMMFQETAFGESTLHTPTDPRAMVDAWWINSVSAKVNYTKASEPFNHQYHHMLPWECFYGWDVPNQKYGEFAPGELQLIQGSGYNLNDGRNMIILPMAKAYGDAMRLPVHYEGHYKYSRTLRTMLNEVRQQLAAANPLHVIDATNVGNLKTQLEAWEDRQFHHIMAYAAGGGHPRHRRVPARLLHHRRHGREPGPRLGAPSMPRFSILTSPDDGAACCVLHLPRAYPEPLRPARGAPMGGPPPGRLLLPHGAGDPEPPRHRPHRQRARVSHGHRAPQAPPRGARHRARGVPPLHARRPQGPGGQRPLLHREPPGRRRPAPIRRGPGASRTRSSRGSSSSSTSSSSTRTGSHPTSASRASRSARGSSSSATICAGSWRAPASRARATWSKGRSTCDPHERPPGRPRELRLPAARQPGRRGARRLRRRRLLHHHPRLSPPRHRRPARRDRHRRAARGPGQERAGVRPVPHARPGGRPRLRPEALLHEPGGPVLGRARRGGTSTRPGSSPPSRRRPISPTWSTRTTSSATTSSTASSSTRTIAPDRGAAGALGAGAGGRGVGVARRPAPHPRRRRGPRSRMPSTA